MNDILLNNNFKEFARTLLLGSTNENGSSFSYSNGLYSTSGSVICRLFSPIKSVDGNVYSLIQQSGVSFLNFALSRFNNDVAANVGVKFHVGSGTTAPTVEDYDLQSKFEASVATVGAISATKVYENGVGKFVYSVPISNVSSSSIIVSEIGIYQRVSQPANTSFLLGRCVLATPVTIESGESKVVHVSFGF